MCGKKAKMRKALKEWKKEYGKSKEYRRKKREYKKVEIKRREENERWKRKAEAAKTEGQV